MITKVNLMNEIKSMNEMVLKTILLSIFILLILSSSSLYGQDDLRAIPDPDPMIQQEMMHVPEGFEVNLFASEPMVEKPIQMNWDAEGRLWVVGSTAYPQPTPGEQPNDKIFILEDTNGDGVADRSTVFAEGLTIPTGILPGDGGVYVANSTEILFLKDTTGDGQADHREVVLSGFGTADSHHLIHTFRWGPDGMLYFNQSIYIFSHVETPHGIRRLEGGGVWQLRPETLELDVYARGLVNPWGLQFNKWGHSFLTDGAGGDGINFGFPGIQFLATPGAERIIRGLNPGQPKHSGLDVISGRHLPESWEGSLITNDYRANRINRFVLDEQGSGFTSEQAEDILWSNHVAFRPVDITVGPDGAIYIADWYNPIIQHGEVDFRDERRDLERGRIWRLQATDRPLVNPPDLTEASINDLFEALMLPEQWTRSQARQVLKERDRDEVTGELQSWWQSLDRSLENYEHHLLEALWVFQAHDVIQIDLLEQLLIAENHNARAAAARVLYYWQDRVPDFLDYLSNLVRDPHPMVRREAVIALRHHPSADAAGIALSVLDDSMDQYLDYALWQTVRALEPYWLERIQTDPEFLINSRQRAYALKSVGNSDAVRLLVDMYLEDEVPEEYQDDVLQSVARWGSINELNRIYQLVLNENMIHSDGVTAYLNALEEASLRQNLKPAYDNNRIYEFTDSDNVQAALSAIRLIGYWQLTEFRDELVDLAYLEEGEKQRMALEALSEMEDEESRQILTDIAMSSDLFRLRVLSVIQIASFDIELAANLAIDILQNWEDELDPVELYSPFFQREEGTRLIAEKISEQGIPEDVARAGRQAMQQQIPWYRQGDQNTANLAEAFEASGGTLPPERMPQDLSAQQINNLEREIRTTADPARGEKIYRMNQLMCMNCHAIGGAGGLVGPDLSSLGRSAPMDNIIHAMINPNRTIKEGYELTRVQRTDGSMVMGTLIRETSSEVVMRDAGDNEVSIPINSVEEIDVVPGSLMPPGLTAQLEREEFVDLIGFLSQLGEPGDFRVPDARLVRRWRMLGNVNQVVELLNDRGTAAVVTSDENELQWRSMYSLVSGTLPLDEIPVVESESGQQMSFVRFEVDVQSAGNIVLELNSVSGIELFAGNEVVSPQGNSFTFDLDEGIQQISLVIDQDQFDHEHLEIQLADASDNPAQAQIVLGK
jgi:putative heme-binding domain-containing protein